ncbi:transposase [Streptomyces sp. AC550_RSS872]|uniref:transposase n=1 Tax=Streptomyces sp. AC550_RSS872 TaxID=2823689 RepID=UPI001C26AEC2
MSCGSATPWTPSWTARRPETCRRACPAGASLRKHCTSWQRAAFPVSVCRSCLVRPQWTTATLGRRKLSWHPREVHEARHVARAARDTTAWQSKYALRAGVEGTIRQPCLSPAYVGPGSGTA